MQPTIKILKHLFSSKCNSFSNASKSYNNLTSFLNFELGAIFTKLFTVKSVHFNSNLVKILPAFNSLIRMQPVFGVLIE